MKNLAASLIDIDKQYLENIRNLQHKITAVQHAQQEISRALQAIRCRVLALHAEMLHGRPRAAPLN
ncbi:MAG TPA: hypothetical protein VJ548_05265 [Azospira sp.]|nr:hypothetical protein [Azospira sp.]